MAILFTLLVSPNPSRQPWLFSVIRAPDPPRHQQTLVALSSQHIHWLITRASSIIVTLIRGIMIDLDCYPEGMPKPWLALSTRPLSKTVTLSHSKAFHIIWKQSHDNDRKAHFWCSSVTTVFVSHSSPLIYSSLATLAELFLQHASTSTCGLGTPSSLYGESSFFPHYFIISLCQCCHPNETSSLILTVWD